MKLNAYFPECLAAAAAGALLFVAGITDPRLGPLASFLSPAAFVLVTVRRGPLTGAVSALLAAAMALPLVHSLPAALSFPSGSAFPGVLLGHLIRRRRGTVLSSLVAASAALALSFAAASAHFALAGLDVPTFLAYQGADLQRETMAAFEEVTAGGGGLSPVDTARLVEFVARVIPVILLTTLLVQFALNARLSCFVLSKDRKTPIPPLPPLSSFRLPDSLIWLLIASLALLLPPSTTFRTAALNALLFLLFLYLLQGLSVSVHFLDRARVARPLRLVLVILVLLQVHLLLLPLLAGLLDFRFDFRRPREALPGPS